MKLLSVLKYLINTIFILFLLTGISVHVLSFYNEPSYTSQAGFWWSQLFILMYELVVLMVLYGLLRFVLSADKGTPLDASTRKYLKLSGVFCLVSGVLSCGQVAGIFTYYSANGGYTNQFFVDVLWGSIPVFFVVFIGVFFLYLSDVLAFSDEMRQENKLTI